MAGVEFDAKGNDFGLILTIWEEGTWKSGSSLVGFSSSGMGVLHRLFVKEFARSFSFSSRWRSSMMRVTGMRRKGNVFEAVDY